MKNIENKFNYHPPKDDHIEKYTDIIRANCQLTAEIIDKHCPESREKSLAITKLEECMMWAIASIVRNETF